MERTPETQPVAANSDQRPLKVVLLCHSDKLGGASVVTRRLMQALRLEGVDARMVVFNKLSEDENVDVPATRFRRGVAFMTERERILLRNGFSRRNLFKVSIASDGLPLHRHPWVREADVICLSWINQGLLSLKGIRRIAALGKPIVWTMHDMWNLTGICHHALECRAWEGECGFCPYLNAKSPTDLSHKVWLRKRKLYSDLPITFVAVSNWLADCCRRSSLMRDADIRVIPNAFPIDSFITSAKFSLHRVSETAKIILMGAARLDDPIKGLPMAIDALNYIFDNYPEVARDSVAVFFGSVRDLSIFDKLRFPHQLLGNIQDGNILRQLYARSSVVISSSLYETLPGTLIEGQAAGCLPVTFGRGGQSDIVDHKVNGYIARYQDVEDFAEGILWALRNPADRDRLHDEVRRRFSARSVARSYLALFRSLLNSEAGKDGNRDKTV